MDTTRRDRSRRRRTCLIEGLACAVVVGVVSAWALPIVWPIFTAHPRPVDLTRLSALTGLHFPPSARLVSSSYCDVLRARLDAEVHISADEVKAFLEAQRPAIERWESYRPELHDAPEVKREALPLSFSIDPPRFHPPSPRQDLKVVDVAVTVRNDDVAVVSIIVSGD